MDTYQVFNLRICAILHIGNNKTIVLFWKLVCPVCREEICYKFDDLDASPIEDKFVFEPTPELQEMQARMASMFEKQKAKGGIIDIEAERNKYLIKHGVSFYLFCWVLRSYGNFPAFTGGGRRQVPLCTSEHQNRLTNVP